MGKIKYTQEFKNKVLEDYHNRSCTVKELITAYNINQHTLYAWLRAEKNISSKIKEQSSEETEVKDTSFDFDSKPEEDLTSEEATIKILQVENAEFFSQIRILQSEIQDLKQQLDKSNHTIELLKNTLWCLIDRTK